MTFLKTRRWAIGLGLVVATLFFVRWLSWNRLRPVIAWSTETFTGVRVDIRGDLRVVPSGNLEIEAGDVALSDRRDDVKRAPFFETEHLGVVWHLPSLRQHKVLLREGALGASRLYLDRFAPSPTQEKAPSETAHSDNSWQVAWTKTVVPNFALFQKDHRILQLAGHLNGQLVLAPLALRGHVAVSGSGLDQTLKAFGYDTANPVGSYQVEGDVQFRPNVLKIDQLNAKIQDSTLTASQLDLAFAPQLAVTTFLHFTELHFQDLGTFLPHKMQEELPASRLSGKRRSLYSDVPIATSWLSGPRLDIQAKVERFFGDGKASLIHSFEVTAKVADGIAAISVPRSNIMDGNLRADLTLRAKTPGLAVHFTGEAQKLHTGRIFQEFLLSDALKRQKFGKLPADELFEGQMDAFLNVSGSGVSLNQIMATLAGDAGIYVGEGKMSSLLVELLGLDVTETIGVFLAQNQKVGMQCAIIGAKATGGVLKFDPAYVSTSDSDLTANGQLDLGKEAVKLEIRTYPKDVSLGVLRTPIKIQGPLVDPRLSLDAKDLAARVAIGVALGLLTPAAAVLATIEPGDAPPRECETYRLRLMNLRTAH